MSETAAGRSEKDDTFAGQDELLLGVLTAIERDSNTSQRTISREMGVALGLANAYLKRCVRKGLVKIQQVPRRRYVYYLTPNGFAEKARLTGQYLSASFTFFRRARAQMSALMEECVGNGWRRVAIAGLSDLAEVAILSAPEHQVVLVAVIDPVSAGETFHQLPVVASVRDCGDIDAVIVTSLIHPEPVFHAMQEQMEPGRVLAPPLLRLFGRLGSSGIEAGQAAE